VRLQDQNLTCQPYFNGKIRSMNPIDLDPEGYSGTYKLVGGRLALDFINTVSWPHKEWRHDWLSSGENLIRWGQAVGIQLPPAKDEDLTAVRGLRSDLDRIVRPLVGGAKRSRSAVEALNQHIAWAFTHKRVSPTALEWAWVDQHEVLHFLAPVVIDAADIVTSSPHDRLRHCPSCDWLFEDHSRNGQRRWCDMADCGSRAKARRYYHRQQH
jgi:predicted RNA-binding Zn ribbon-like protein